jgi:hypothetical protein
MDADESMTRCHGVLIRSAIVVVLASVVLIPLFA